LNIFVKRCILYQANNVLAANFLFLLRRLLETGVANGDDEEEGPVIEEGEVLDCLLTRISKSATMYLFCSIRFFMVYT
jgi:hypothetical protein